MANVFLPEAKVIATKARIKRKKGARQDEDVGKPLQSGVVYVGHLPHGFFEEQLMGYFSQFGTVKKVKVSRNKKSGHCRGFGFVEFECDEVAKIVSQTMNNYLMFNKLLKCQFIGHGDVHPGMLGTKGRIRKKISLRSRCHQAQIEHNKHHTTSGHLKRVQKLVSRENRKRSALIKLGITYDFPGYKSCIKESNYARKPSHIKFED